jgi:hypothetical protein
MKENWFTYFPDNYRWSAGLIIAAEGGSQHCQNDRLGVAIPFMHDWLAEKLKA